MKSVWEKGWGFQNIRISLQCTLCKSSLAFVIQVRGYKFMLKCFLVGSMGREDKKE